MAQATKKISEWEAARGVLLVDVSKLDLDSQVTAEEFDELVGEKMDNVKGCNHDFRVKWLKKNGYEVTRENMLDGNLPSLEEKA